jgi:hypothetical protein
MYGNVLYVCAVQQSIEPTQSPVVMFSVNIVHIQAQCVIKVLGNPLAI